MVLHAVRALVSLCFSVWKKINAVEFGDNLSGIRQRNQTWIGFFCGAPHPLWVSAGFWTRSCFPRREFEEYQLKTIMRLPKSIAALSAIAVCALAVCNAHAQTNMATFNATLFVQQPVINNVNSAVIPSKPTVL